jgi:hypothetical protein
MLYKNNTFILVKFHKKSVCFFVEEQLFLIYKAGSKIYNTIGILMERNEKHETFAQTHPCSFADSGNDLVHDPGNGNRGNGIPDCLSGQRCQ